MKKWMKVSILELGLGLVTVPHLSAAQEASALSLDLATALSLALKNNEAVLIAEEDQEKAGAQVRAVRADALPQVNVSMLYDRNFSLPNIIFDTPEGRESFTVGTRNNVSSAISLRQPIYSGGKVKAALKVADSFQALSKEQARSVEQQVLTEVERLFYDVLLARELVHVQNLAIEHARANLNQVQQLHDGGRVSEYDLLRAQVLLGTLQPDALRASNQLTQAKTDLKNAVGLEPEVSIAVVGAFRQTTTLALDSVDGLMQQGLKIRPEVRQANYQVEIEDQRIDIARAAYQPSVDLLVSSQWQFQSNELKFNRDEVRQSWTAGFSVQMPLFDGLRTRAQITEAKTNKRLAKLEAQQLKRSIRSQIRQAWLDVKEAQARLEAQQGTVTQARQGYAIASSRYSNGIGTQLEILDARLSLTQAQTEYARAQRDIAVSIVTLEQAVGITIQHPLENLH